MPDPSTNEDAIALLDQYGIEVSDAAQGKLHDPQNETPKPGDKIFENAAFSMISTPGDMLQTVTDECGSLDIDVISLGADLEGESREVAKDQARLIREIRESGRQALILSGGETTVTVADGTKPGRGGRDCEFLLALAIELDGMENVFALAADTDGIDGSEDNAGAILSPDSLERARAVGADARDFLTRHDSYSFFEKIDDLIVTGPTRTNVNDFRAILVL